jgi:hypothetical protein
MHAVLICLLNTQKKIFNRYIMFGRGICEKDQSIDEEFSEPTDEWNLVSRLVFFSQIVPPNMIYLFNFTEYYLENCLNKYYLLFVVFRNILFSLFVSGTFSLVINLLRNFDFCYFFMGISPCCCRLTFFFIVLRYLKQTMKTEYSWKRQTKGIIYLASVFN